MNILPVSCYNKPNNLHPTHRANSRWVSNNVGKQLYMTTTYFFRDDIDWKKLIKFLCAKYKNVSKVNVLNHACSNGMEPYSFVMQLLHSKPEDAEKFFPVIAKDLNYENIFAAKIGKCGASRSDHERAQQFLDYNLWQYVDWNKSNNSLNDMILNPKPFVKEKIEFLQGDIFRDIKHLPPKNNVLLCRNFWLYLTPQEQEILLKTLAEKFDKSSTLIMGNYDFINNFKLKLDLDYYGFKEDMPYVFSKNC